jgi:hypothetical protein
MATNQYKAHVQTIKQYANTLLIQNKIDRESFLQSLPLQDIQYINSLMIGTPEVKKVIDAVNQTPQKWVLREVGQPKEMCILTNTMYVNIMLGKYQLKNEGNVYYVECLNDEGAFLIA